MLGMSFASKAADVCPWDTFKEVVHTYKTASGQFLNLTETEKMEFLKAADAMKVRLAKHENEFSKAKLKKINVAVNIFKFIWESKPVPVMVDEEVPVPPTLS